MSTLHRLPVFAHKHRRASGFTLIELMVVATVASILMAMGLVAYTNAQRGARDSKRRSDIRAIQLASEQFFGDNGNLYPTTPSDLNPYFPSRQVPADPKSTQSYSQTMSATAYCWCATMESPNTGNSGSNCAIGSSKTHFCVNQRQ